MSKVMTTIYTENSFKIMTDSQLDVAKFNSLSLLQL